MYRSRRHFLKTSGAFALGFAGLQSFAGCRSSARGTKVPTTNPDPFGSLLADPDGILDLPADFSYRIISRMSDDMSDGFLVPGLPDGMSTFPGDNGRTILIRNHELNPDSGPEMGAFGPNLELLKQLPPAMLYDAGTGNTPALGGTTTVIYDTGAQRVESQYLSLAGTLRNCAGGRTPWNSWISCEEYVSSAGGSFAKDHGYVFEVPASMKQQLVRPVPLTDMGRFYHEAVAVDPSSHVVYQTEDRHDGLIYRFLPNVPEQLDAGGRLQALVVMGQPSLDTRNWEEQTVRPGEPHSVRWIDLDDIHSPDDDLRVRGFDNGAARFARGEGMWYGRESVFFACTNGGSAELGQIWQYRPSPYEGRTHEEGQPGTLELFIESEDPGLLEHADNLTVTPWGDLILCEDGPGEQFLVGVTPAGDLYKFARNAGSQSEFAGATFSPDGTTLFVNMQTDGLTLAITGPWR